MAYTGNDDTTGYNSVIANGSANDANMVKAIIAPIGAIMPWLKTFNSISSGTTDGTTTNKIVDSGATFATDGAAVNMIVLNTTDNTESYLTAVDSETTLSIPTDIFASGEDYEIYATRALPDGWVECNGQVLSDADSPYNGATIPDLNAFKTSADYIYLRGGGSADSATPTTSGDTGTDGNHFHQFNTRDGDGGDAGHQTGPVFTGLTNVSIGYPETDSVSIAYKAPINYFGVVYIMRVK